MSRCASMKSSKDSSVSGGATLMTGRQQPLGMLSSAAETGCLYKAQAH